MWIAKVLFAFFRERIEVAALLPIEDEKLASVLPIGARLEARHSQIVVEMEAAIEKKLPGFLSLSSRLRRDRSRERISADLSIESQRADLHSIVSLCLCGEHLLTTEAQRTQSHLTTIASLEMIRNIKYFRAFVRVRLTSVRGRMSK